MMLAAEIIFAPLMFLSLAKLTKQAKEEDCIKGKQYWSEESFIPGKDGVCIACPPNWLTCYDQLLGNDNRKRCVDSCRAKPKSSSIPTKVIPSTPTSVAYTLVGRDVEPLVKKRSDGNKKLQENIGLIVAVSAFAVFIAIACGVALLFVIRKSRSRSPRGRSRDRNNQEEHINLQEMNEQNDGEQHMQEQIRHEEERHDDEVLLARDTENCLVSAQEPPTPGPVQATPSERNICGIQDTEGGNFKSCFHLNQVET